MIYDIQRASVLKRISAYIFDIILIVIAATGVAFLLSVVMNYDALIDELDGIYKKYETEYGVDFDISAEDYEKLTDEQRLNFENASKALSADPEGSYVYTMIVNYTMIMITFALLISFLLLEFAVPLLFRNGQTLGKKIFGIAVMRNDGVRLTAPMLFARTVLGKFTVETMIPVFLVLLVLFGAMGVIATAVIAAIILANFIMLFATKNRLQIHDLLASTVVVDMATQMIFDSPEELLEHKKRIQRDIAEREEY